MSFTLTENNGRIDCKYRGDRKYITIIAYLIESMALPMKNATSLNIGFK